MKSDGIPYPGTPEWAGFSPKSHVGQLPVMQDGDVTIGQSGAILRYLVKKFGICADITLPDYAVSEQLIDQAADIHSLLTKAHYSPDRTAAMDAVFADGSGLHKVLAAFEALATDAGFFGSKPTPGDLAFAASLDMIRRLEAEALAKYAKLSALHKAATANEAVAAVNASTPYPYFKRKSD